MGKRQISASRVKRIMNGIIDSILCIFFGPLFYKTIFIIFGDNIFANMVRNLNMFVFILPYIVYYLSFEYIWQKTPAKFVTKTKVVAQDGKRPTLANIAIRTLSRFIPFDWITFISDNNPNGWHDRWSKTVVIDDKNIKSR